MNGESLKKVWIKILKFTQVSERVRKFAESFLQQANFKISITSWSSHYEIKEFHVTSSTEWQKGKQKSEKVKNQ